MKAKHAGPSKSLVNSKYTVKGTPRFSGAVKGSANTDGLWGDGGAQSKQRASR